MKKLTTFITALLLIVGMTQCKKTEKQATAEQEGDGTHICLNVSISNDAKTAITAAGIVSWSAGDKLCVVGSEDGNLGTLTTEAGGSSSAKFEGTITPITATEQTIHFYYLGNTTTDGTSYTYDITAQNGTLEGLAGLHLMHGYATATAGQTTFNNVTMNNMMAIALFDISGYGSEAKCTDAISSRTLNLTTGDWDGNGTTATTETPITLSNPSANYYMALIPSTAEQTLKFSSSDGKFQSTTKKTIVAGTSYTNDEEAIIIYSEDCIDFNDPDPDIDISNMPIWSKKNLGAENATDAGKYYAWGEVTAYGEYTEPYPTAGTHGDWDRTENKNYYDKTATTPAIKKTTYNYKFYKWGEDGNINHKYTGSPTVLADEDDAAYQNMEEKGKWHIPSGDEIAQLNKLVRVRILNSYNGTGPSGLVIFKVKDKNDLTASASDADGLNVSINGRTYSVDKDDHIFIPDIKYKNDNSETDSPLYWLNYMNPARPTQAYYFSAKNTYISPKSTDYIRGRGLPIRPVKRKASQSGQEPGR